MNKKINCWEFKKCGREPGGAKADELGICPAATATKVNKVNNGDNGGRCCWAVTGTLCGDEVQGTFSGKMLNCMQCDFYINVFKEEFRLPNYKNPVEIQKILGK